MSIFPRLRAFLSELCSSFSKGFAAGLSLSESVMSLVANTATYVVGLIITPLFLVSALLIAVFYLVGHVSLFGVLRSLIHFGRMALSALGL